MALTPIVTVQLANITICETIISDQVSLEESINAFIAPKYVQLFAELLSYLIFQTFILRESEFEFFKMPVIPLVADLYYEIVLIFESNIYRLNIVIYENVTNANAPDDTLILIQSPSILKSDPQSVIFYIIVFSSNMTEPYIFPTIPPVIGILEKVVILQLIVSILLNLMLDKLLNATYPADIAELYDYDNIVIFQIEVCQITQFVYYTYDITLLEQEQPLFIDSLYIIESYMRHLEISKSFTLAANPMIPDEYELLFYVVIFSQIQIYTPIYLLKLYGLYKQPNIPPQTLQVSMVQQISLEFDNTKLLTVKLLFQYPPTSATLDAALILPYIIELFSSAQLALHFPINAAIFISLSSQLDFQMEAKLIYILLNEPSEHSEDKYPIVPKLENYPTPEVEQYMLVLEIEIFPPTVPKSPDYFTIDPAYVVCSKQHSYTIVINVAFDSPIIAPELYILLVVCLEQI
ncbi:Hypothetical_protein [Hexamita inflata]|uniref:Hypothetical_protein n=1 Tax=Hexamita inflata TaxID=28002 RepID=A0AA86NGR3_9EUKA|nr:Hypothetical protein HINF_LOCUS7030 [Hexamita inflata]